MTQAQDQEIEHLEALAATYRRRLRVLERQIAQFGMHAPAYLITERDQAERDLAQAQAELRRLRPAAPAERAPYLGLHTFQERDADLFFGRERLVDELVARAEHTSFLAVLGASGSGKSSVVRAGLIPELRGGALPGSQHWRYAVLKPGDRPLDALAAALAKLQGADLSDALALRDQLGKDAGGLLFAARMLLDSPEDARLVLMVDQAEELWTLAPADPERRAEFIEQQQRPFIELLLAATASERLPVLVVLAMRADFLHRAAEQRDLARAIGEHDLIVSPMQPDELRRAIEEPAGLAGCVFGPGLADELVDQVQGQPGALPLLEYALLELWRNKHPDGTLTWQAFKDIGGVEGALAARADAILKERYPAPERQDELRRALLRLVQPGEGAADTRRRALLADLAPAGGSVADVQALLQPLVDARLIVVSRAESREPQNRRTAEQRAGNRGPGTGGRRTTDDRLWTICGRGGARGADPRLADLRRLDRGGAC